MRQDTRERERHEKMREREGETYVRNLNLKCTIIVSCEYSTGHCSIVVRYSIMSTSQVLYENVMKL